MTTDTTQNAPRKIYRPVKTTGAPSAGRSGLRLLPDRRKTNKPVAIDRRGPRRDPYTIPPVKR